MQYGIEVFSSCVGCENMGCIGSCGVYVYLRYILACRIGAELAHLIRKHKLMDDPEMVGALQVMVGEEMFLLLHLTMFMGTLEAMCTEEQVQP